MTSGDVSDFGETRLSSHPQGHLFVINGDLTSLQCDAVLVPTDGDFRITKGFAPLVGETEEHLLTSRPESGWVPQAAVPWPSSTPGARVWLGQLGGTETTPVEHFVGCARNFVTSAAVQAHATHRNRPLPLLALPVVGSGAGGGAIRRGEILKQLVPELTRLARSENVDIVLVTWGRVTYEAAQAVRRDCRKQSGIDAADLSKREMQLAAGLAGHARRGNLVAFVGAGVSANAGLPAWQGLLDDVARGMRFTDTDLAQMHELDMRDQASLLSDRDDSFKASVTKALDTAHFSLTHGLLASLPIKEFVTTNFDTLLEGAAKGPGNGITVLPSSSPTPASRWLVKLHGTLGSNLVLTRSEYRDARSQHGALFGLLQALLLTKHMMFVGYSMQDEDFNDVIHEVRLLHSQRPKAEGETQTHDNAATTSGKFGTVVVSFENPQFERLWNDLEVVPLRGPLPVEDGKLKAPTPADWWDVGRRLSLFLDQIALESASDVGFVTDKTLQSVGGDSAKALADAIDHLWAVYRAHCDDDPNQSKWSEIRVVLDALTRRAPEDGHISAD